MIAVFALSFIGLLCISAPITVALGGCSLVYALVGGNVSAAVTPRPVRI